MTMSYLLLCLWGGWCLLLEHLRFPWCAGNMYPTCTFLRVGVTDDGINFSLVLSPGGRSGSTAVLLFAVKYVPLSWLFNDNLRPTILRGGS